MGQEWQECTRCERLHDRQTQEGFWEALCGDCESRRKRSCAECNRSFHGAFVDATNLTDGGSEYYGQTLPEIVRFCLPCWGRLEESEDWWEIGARIHA